MEPRTKVLLVEDDSDTRELLQELLAETFDVRHAANGEEALSLALLDPPQILLTDHLLPGLEGTELAKLFKLAFPHVRVILVSGYSAGLDTSACDEVLPKPID